MRKSRTGCEINGIFYGAIIYADDIFLLSASRNGLQNLVNLSNSFARSRNLIFGTDPDPNKSKSKCLIFYKKDMKNVKNIELNGGILPWVKNIKYLGFILEENNSMNQDILRKDV